MWKLLKLYHSFLHVFLGKKKKKVERCQSDAYDDCDIFFSLPAPNVVASFSPTK